MNASIADLVRHIHARSAPLALAVTGGGSGAIAELLRVPGASRTLLEAVVPYSAASLAAFLGASPERACAPRTARAMAMAAFQRARVYGASPSVSADTQGIAETPREIDTLGVACTGCLVSDRPKKGRHRVHVAAQSCSATATWSLELVKGRRSRADEEDLATHLVLNAVAESAGVDQQIELTLAAGEEVIANRTEAPLDWQDLLLGRRNVAYLGPDRSAEPARAIFPGAFNPIHVGHRRMAELAADRLRRPVEFEVSIENVDKPPLDFTEMDDRARQLAPAESLCFTRAATFAEKAGLFPRATFVVGADTIVRIADARYYGGSADACRSAIVRIAAAGCRFLVFGRHDQGAFLSLRQLDLPQELRAMCDEVPEEQFRQDVSSTEIRRGQPAEE